MGNSCTLIDLESSLVFWVISIQLYKMLRASRLRAAYFGNEISDKMHLVPTSGS